MGIDICAKKPTNKVAEGGICMSYPSWGIVAAYVQMAAGDVSLSCKYWNSSDGDGLNKAQSLRLAKRLRKLVELDHPFQFYAFLDAAHIFGCNKELVSRHYRFCKKTLPMFIEFLEGCGGFTID